MSDSMRGMWWGFLLRGIIAILFGIAAFVWPGLTGQILVSLFCAFILVDGIFAVLSVIMGTSPRPGWATLLEGVLGVVLGIWGFLAPDAVGAALIYVIAAWMIATGIMEIFAAIRLRKEIEGEFWLGLAGALSILAGIFVALQPVAGALAIIWAIGGYAIVFGIFLIMVGFRIRNLPTTGAASGTA